MGANETEYTKCINVALRSIRNVLYMQKTINHIHASLVRAVRALVYISIVGITKMCGLKVHLK